MTDSTLNNEKAKKEKERQTGRISVSEKLAEKKEIIKQRDRVDKKNLENGTEKKSEREM